MKTFGAPRQDASQGETHLACSRSEASFLLAGVALRELDGVFSLASTFACVDLSSRGVVALATLLLFTGVVNPGLCLTGEAAVFVDDFFAELAREEGDFGELRLEEGVLGDRISRDP